MHYKKELCRHFQRGSCQYGERCKYLHVMQQQPKSNAFGFGSQAGSQQQQKPNPFGFGVQNDPQSKGASNFGNKQNQFKPFENKWTRFSPIPNNGASSSRQPDNQPQAANHNYEELRAAAYDDAKRGLSLQSIVERERNLLNSKLMEFDNLLRNPYTGPFNSALASESPFPPVTSSAFSPTPQNSGFSPTPQNRAPPAVSIFNQLGTSLNMGFGTRPSAPSNNAFGQPSSLPNSSLTLGVFGTNNLPSASSGPFDSHQFPARAISNPFTSNMTSSGNSGVFGDGSSKFSALAWPNPSPFSFSNQPSIPSSGPVPSSTAAEQATTNIQLVKNLQNKTVAGDTSVWLTEIWNHGEIPEEAPPEQFCTI